MRKVIDSLSFLLKSGQLIVLVLSKNRKDLQMLTMYYSLNLFLSSLNYNRIQVVTSLQEQDTNREVVSMVGT